MLFTMILKRLVLTTVLVSSFVFVACTPAQQQMLEGVLRNVDNANGTITITDKNGQTRIINIRAETKIQTQSGNSALEALEPGVTLKIELESGNATGRIEARLARVQGAISQVNAANRQITVTPRQGGQAVTVNITGTTRIKLREDNTGSFSDLTVGAVVEVKYNADTRVAFSVSIGKMETAEIEGTIASVAGSNITIQASKRRSLTLATDTNTEIRMKGNTGTLADLLVNTRVHVKFDPFTNLATRIEVQGPEDGNNQKGKGPKVEDNFTAHLSGNEELPAVNTRGEGEAIFHLSDDGLMLSFKLNVSNTDNVQMSHIHMAARGQNGAVVVWLYPSRPPAVKIPGRFDGMLASGNITAANLVGPLQGQPLSALIEQIRNGKTYVNVHTERYPGGEIRGQISSGEDNRGRSSGENSSGNRGEGNREDSSGRS